MAGLTAAAEELGAAAKITTNAGLRARRVGEGRRHIRLIDHHFALYVQGGCTGFDIAFKLQIRSCPSCQFSVILRFSPKVVMVLHGVSKGCGTGLGVP